MAKIDEMSWRELLAELERVKAERDAAVREIGQNCGNCACHSPESTWSGNGHVRPCGEPIDNPYDFYHQAACDGWEWCGIRAATDAEEGGEE